MKFGTSAVRKRVPESLQCVTITLYDIITNRELCLEGRCGTPDHDEIRHAHRDTIRGPAFTLIFVVLMEILRRSWRRYENAGVVRAFRLHDQF